MTTPDSDLIGFNDSDIAAVLDAELTAEGAKTERYDTGTETGLLGVFTHRDITHQFVDLEDLVAKHRPAPRRAKGTVRARTLDGVQEAIARLAHDRPVLYHDPETLQVTVILNDHAGSNGADTSPTPGWQDHRIEWKPTLTPEWRHWVDHQGLHSPLSFAEILEDGEAEIQEPTVADMLEIVHTIKGTSNAKYRTQGRPKTGVTQLIYEEQSEVRAGEKGDLTIPDTIVLALRPFFGSDPWKVKARIRYRLSEGNLSIGYKLHRSDDVIRHAFDGHVAELLDQLEDVDTIEGLAGGG